MEQSSLSAPLSGRVLPPVPLALAGDLFTVGMSAPQQHELVMAECIRVQSAMSTLIVKFMAHLMSTPWVPSTHLPSTSLHLDGPSTEITLRIACYPGTGAQNRTVWGGA